MDATQIVELEQRLEMNVDGQRVAAIEILLHSPMVETLIKRGEVVSLKEIMEKAVGAGMQTFDQTLFNLPLEAMPEPEEEKPSAPPPAVSRIPLRPGGGG